MARSKRTKAATLSISLPQELANAIEERIQSGLYTSASELIREALRLLLRSEAGPSPAAGLGTGAARRLATAFELAETGAAMRAERQQRTARQDAAAEPLDVREAVALRQELGPGLRLSPERLKKLRIE